MVKKITRYECDICGSTFPSESKAADCESNHEGKRPVVNEKAEIMKYCWCNNCGKYEENCECDEPDFEYC